MDDSRALAQPRSHSHLAQGRTGSGIGGHRLGRRHGLGTADLADVRPLQPTTSHGPVRAD